MNYKYNTFKSDGRLLLLFQKIILGLGITGTILFILDLFMRIPSDWHEFLFGIALISFLLSSIFEFILIFKLWKILPAKYKYLSDRQILLFTVIPIINVFGVFVYFRGLAQAVNNYVTDLEKTNTKMFNMKIATLTSFTWFLMFFYFTIPFVAVFTFIFSFLFFKQVINAFEYINSTMNDEKIS